MRVHPRFRRGGYMRACVVCLCVCALIARRSDGVRTQQRSSVKSLHTATEVRRFPVATQPEETTGEQARGEERTALFDWQLRGPLGDWPAGCLPSQPEWREGGGRKAAGGGGCGGGDSRVNPAPSPHLSPSLLFFFLTHTSRRIVLRLLVLHPRPTK